MNMVNFLLPLYLAGSVKNIRGKTRLQKLVFLCQKKIVDNFGMEESYKFEAGTYGPYSKELAETVKFMQGKNLVSERVETNKDKTLFTYQLTKTGKNLLEQNKVFTPKIKAAISEVVKDYNKMNLSDLVDRVHEEFPSLVK